MLIDRRPFEDVFTRVPELAAQPLIELCLLHSATQRLIGDTQVLGDDRDRLVATVIEPDSFGLEGGG
jgi:hypothetical protein